MSKIGILGGTFDPIHNGHIELLKTVKKEMEFSKIIVVPNGNPPHKENSADKKHRFNMVNNALCDFPDYIVCDYEINKDTPSYSYETVEYLKNEYPEDELYFIMGTDNLEEFKFWVKPERICELCKLVFLGREQFEFSSDEVEHLKTTLNADISFIEFNYLCSSTEIKEDIEAGKYVFDKISTDTMKYILRNGLYNTSNVSEYDFYEHELSKFVEEKRFKHSIGVALCAYTLAKRYNEDTKLAYFTGLVHDIAKRLPFSEQLSLCNNIKLFPDERNYPKMLHAPAGSAFLKQKYNITDEKLLNAVRLHTIGDGKMSLFDKIIYMADYIEPYRDFDGVEKLRELSYTDINAAVIKGIDITVLSLIEDEMKISTHMLDVRNELLDDIKENKTGGIRI